MSRLRSFYYALGDALLGPSAQAQSPTATANRLGFSQQRYTHTRTLGLSLGGYALANIRPSQQTPRSGR
ncbi:hypothetical protein [Fibrella aquatilis]|uniref:hypothetical protein n=1 Tax=Fibrella aquatilis TaxID=2817059 RepID=UPI001E5D156C|nr:hypothetical protein [Fibrella aquatilis]